VGLVELTVHSPDGASAEMGYAVHPSCWGRGIATAAARLAAQFAFDDLGVQRLLATCDTTNAASVRVLEKLGMHLDKTVHRHMLLGARWRDTHVEEHPAAT
jgi:RimJ/RimL family protein N-acetyltransferase